jgi:hypothetical protein
VRCCFGKKNNSTKPTKRRRRLPTIRVRIEFRTPEHGPRTTTDLGIVFRSEYFAPLDFCRQFDQTARYTQTCGAGLRHSATWQLGAVLSDRYGRRHGDGQLERRPLLSGDISNNNNQPHVNMQTDTTTKHTTPPASCRVRVSLCNR